MARKKKEIPKYGTVVLKGVEYYRTRIEDADGRRVALYARTPEELLEKVEEAQRQIEDGGPLSYTQFKRVWQYIVTRSTKERTYVRYINGQKIQRTVTPKLGEKAAHNGNVVYTLENPVKSTVFTRKTESSTASKQPVAHLSSASAELTKRLLPKPWSVKAA